MSDLRNYSLDELREIKELTDHIVANLHAIQEDNNDLEELQDQTSRIVANLHVIEEDPNDLEELDRQTSTVVANLKTIAIAEMNKNEQVGDRR